MSGLAPKPGTCDLPGSDWFCSLDAGHRGPCPTWRTPVQAQVIGITGTRHGMTDQQKAKVELLLTLATEVHHGDCVGADADADAIARKLGRPVVIHPPTDDRLRAFCQSLRTWPPRPYLDRNRDIVDISDHLVATPAEMIEQLSGGTWYTIRYARENGKSTVIVWPDGSVSSGSTVIIWPDEVA